MIISPFSRISIGRHRGARWCALALLLASPGLLAEQTGYYRWKDDKGQMQATQQPPAGRPSEYVKLSTGKSSPAAGEAAAAGAPKAGGNDGEQASKPIQGVPDKDPEKCRQSKETQSVLDSHARIREKGENGEYRYLTPDEISEQKRLVKESVDVYCE